MKPWTDSWALALIKQEQRAYAWLGEWLATYHWQAYVVLTFAYRPSPESAEKAVGEWFRELTAHYPRLNAYYSYDRGPGTDRLNVHLLIGGLHLKKPPRDPDLRAVTTTRFLAMGRRLWHRRGIMQTGEPYDARCGAVSYLAQYHADPNVPPAQFFGRLIKKKKRRHHKARSK